MVQMRAQIHPKEIYIKFIVLSSSKKTGPGGLWGVRGNWESKEKQGLGIFIFLGMGAPIISSVSTRTRMKIHRQEPNTGRDRGGTAYNNWLPRSHP